MTTEEQKPRKPERTDEEIVARISDLLARPAFLDHAPGDLITFLPYEAALPLFTSAPPAPETWSPHLKSEENLRHIILDYLPFAWDKANDCRGLSAARSLSHFSAWVWMLGDEHDALVSELRGDYTHYGKAQLVKVSELVGYDWRRADDGKWRNNEDDEGISADAALGR